MSKPPAFHLSELAERFDLPRHGDSDPLITAVAPLHRATEGDLGFVTGARHRKQLKSCQASALIIEGEVLEQWPGCALLSTNPSADFARIAALFEQLPDYAQGVAAGASVAASATVHPSARIAAGVAIGAGAVIDEAVTIGPGCVIEAGSHIGAGSRLVANVFIGHDCVVGQRALIHPGAVIGADGFGQAWQGEHWVKIPQLGRVVIGDDCEIGANTTIDRGALDDTVLENDVRIDNQVQIAHNVRVGAHTAIAACVGIAGSARIGRYCLIAGAAAINGHIEICDRVVIQGMSSITRSIDKPGEYGSAVAAQEAQRWRRNLARLRNLDSTLRQLIQMTKQHGRNTGDRERD
ncbi:MAG: UDP-3-O-(3-hydroxymyristoyl)glucosamine N-acyltransferase [Wenzhouxiangellaceae bacterium]